MMKKEGLARSKERRARIMSKEKCNEDENGTVRE